MSGARPLCAFFAPLKAPDHPVPSGDRTVARLYVSALEKAGFEVWLASDLRLYDGAGEAAAQQALRAAAAGEVQRLLAVCRRAGARKPDLWFTYHVYHKSPDLIGPAVCKALAIPYAIAEPSHAPKRKRGPWAAFLEESEAAIRNADALFVSTAADLDGVAPLREGRGGMVRLPPFLDAGAFAQSPHPPAGTFSRKREKAEPDTALRASFSRSRERVLQGMREEKLALTPPPPGEEPGSAHPLPQAGEGTLPTLRSVSERAQLITVAMMRPGDKLASYRLLAEALAMIANLDWTMTIAGDGEARGEVELLFAPLAQRVTFAGEITDRAALAALLSASDLFVWPAVNEAYGMAPLEAALMGLPAVVGDEGGVADVVRHGETGLIAPRRDAAAFSAAVRSLLDDAPRRLAMGAAARAFVLNERSLEHAADVLRATLMPLLGARRS